jgi:hypothetical protein
MTTTASVLAVRLPQSTLDLRRTPGIDTVLIIAARLPGSKSAISGEPAPSPCRSVASHPAISRLAASDWSTVPAVAFGERVQVSAVACERAVIGLLGGKRESGEYARRKDEERR